MRISDMRTATAHNYSLPKSMESITYEILKQKRDNGNLTPGMWYRITDYVCTVANDDEAQAVNHPFDIIVVADDENTLNENARACLHDGDTYYSADDCKANLSAWELKYSIDNDTNRFMWADAENGKGVVYWLKDDWGNECPYDFKQIQFKRYEITECEKSSALEGKLAAKEHSNDIIIDEDSFIWCYTFNWLANDSTVEDLSVKQYSHSDDEGMFPHCYDNKIQVYSKGDYEDGNNLYKIFLNNISIICTEEFEMGVYYGIYSNTFGNYCSSNTFGNYCSYNTFGGNCSYNTFGNSCASNTFGDDCASNTFGDDCSYNTFGNSYNSNTFGNSCNSNTFGDSCISNTFGNNCRSNTFGNNCRSNTFGNSCSSNAFGNNCYNITFRGYCHSNTAGNSVQYITLTHVDVSEDDHIYNYHILNGTKGTQGSTKTITGDLNLSYCTYVGLNSSGDIKTWVPADLVG